MRTYLYVPFSEKDDAKKLGARFDVAKSRWYVQGSNLESFSRWIAPTITGFSGEDRAFGGSMLFVDLIPAKCWFTNARSALTPRDWERVRHFVYSRANYTCEICGTLARKALEAHERWSFDETTHIQKLVRLIALCNPCHETTHMGLARIRGREDEAFEHLCKVNGWDYDTADEHVREAYAIWNKRNRLPWTLDLSIFSGNEITFTHTHGGAHVRS